MAIITAKASALAQNFEKLTALIAPAKVFPFIKADGYGLGLDFVVRTLAEHGADTFCTARYEDASAIRQMLPEAQILLCSVYEKPDTVKAILAENIIATVGSVEGLKLCAALREGELAVNVAIDTGMGRFGLRKDELSEFAELYKSISNIHIVSAFTHFANCFGGKKGDKATLIQLERFNETVQEMRNLGLNPGILHAANSAAALLLPESRLDAVRCGSALLGRSAGSSAAGLEKVGRLYGEVLCLRTLRKGETIGYGSIFKAKRDMTIAIIDCGHADGVFLTREHDGFRFSDRLRYIKRDLTQNRLCGTFNGQKLPVVGRVGLTNLAVSVVNSDLKAGDLIEFDFNPVFCGAKEIRYE
ncbi:MAG TPA: alanine racemase [Oscillospiraceae bacterium]|nr:alanine racemase [Oscillospiraceae bacterium]HPF55177.1 alanine racemase [Clostridiales bacterium]HPK34584.1 alanine racemase [Oscillospiraceae bacterium]HPR75952.1 alanine racemase [Oscillospiraceae bacterium]